MDFCHRKDSLGCPGGGALGIFWDSFGMPVTLKILWGDLGCSGSYWIDLNRLVWDFFKRSFGIVWDLLGLLLCLRYSGVLQNAPGCSGMLRDATFQA